MAERDSMRAEDLIAQDHGIAETDLEAIKMNLMTSLSKAEAQAYAVRRALIGSVVGMLVCYLGVIPIELFQLSQFTWAVVMWSVFGWITMLSSLVLFFVYFGKYRPALNRGRWEVQTTAIAELQREVRELRQRWGGGGPS